jgi:hypothetical protein
MLMDMKSGHMTSFFVQRQQSSQDKPGGSTLGEHKKNKQNE